MTDAEQIAARADRGRRFFNVALGALCVVAVLALVGAVIANVVNGQQETKIERFSSCEADPSGDRCQKIKRESDEARSVTDTCRSFWKVGYPCPAPDSGVKLPAAVAGGGDALQPPMRGQQPTPTKAPASQHGDVDRHIQTHPNTATDAPEKSPAVGSPEASPSPTGKPTGEEASGSSTTTSPAEDTPPPESGNGLLNVPGVTVGEPPCPVKTLGLSICTE